MEPALVPRSCSIRLDGGSGATFSSAASSPSSGYGPGNMSAIGQASDPGMAPRGAPGSVRHGRPRTSRSRSAPRLRGTASPTGGRRAVRSVHPARGSRARHPPRTPAAPCTGWRRSRPDRRAGAGRLMLPAPAGTRRPRPSRRLPPSGVRRARVRDPLELHGASIDGRDAVHLPGKMHDLAAREDLPGPAIAHRRAPRLSAPPR